ncbi:MAG: VOC family protein [Phycisphaerae bacterium]|jgi:predicted enzyme related to lactoylglutathione lyase|nr:VOC family protein [Phycisphaerae bacterium]
MSRTELRTVPVEPGMFCWFELTTREVDRSRDFYRSLMRAVTRGLAMGDTEYTLFDIDGKTVAGLMPMGDAFPLESPSHWLPYIAVQDVDAVCREVCPLGGRICCGPTDIPIGRFAVITDPTGGNVALFQSAPGKTDGTNPVGPGTFVWCELVTRDVPIASQFYAKLLGWTPQFRVAGATSFIEMKAGSLPVASVFEACADERTSVAHWCPYLCVEDIHASLAAAVRLGGRKLCEPMEIPGIGTYAGLTDPTGAHLALFEPLDQ